MNTQTQNPYNYMSKDWSVHQEEFARMRKNAVLDIVLDIIKAGREPLDCADDSVKTLYAEMTT